VPPTSQLDQAVVQLFDAFHGVGTDLAAAWVEKYGVDPELDTIFPLLAWSSVAENLQAGRALLTAGSARPSLLVARSTFEVLVSLEYVMHTDTSRRTLAYVAADLVRREIEAEAQLPEGKHHERWSTIFGLPTIDPALIRAKLQQARQPTGNPSLDAAINAYRRLAATRERVPDWGEPLQASSLWVRAEKSGRPEALKALYRIVYGHLSAAAHSVPVRDPRELVRYLTSTSSGTSSGVKSLSDRAELVFAAEAVLALTLEFFEAFSRCALADEAGWSDQLDNLRRRKAELLTAAGGT